MKRVLGLTFCAVVFGSQFAHGQVTEDMCGSSGATLVCTRAKFALSGGDLDVYLFNGVGAASSILSSVQNVGVLNLDGYAGAWSLASVFYQDFGGASGDVSSDWTFITSVPGLHVTFNAGADASGNGGLTTCAGPTGGSGTNYRTCDGSASPSFSGNQDWVLFTFSHTGGTALDAAALTLLDWGWKAQRVGTIGASLECTSKSNNVDTCTSEPGGGELDTVVPEPATMTLMGLGLMGMAARRRRMHCARPLR